MTNQREAEKCPSLLIHRSNSARYATSTCFWINPIGSVHASAIAESPNARGNVSLSEERYRNRPVTLLKGLVLKKIQRKPVIVLAGFGDVPAAVRALKGGAVDFVE